MDQDLSLSPRAPALVSLALRDLPAPDWADVVIVPLPPGSPTDPAFWTRAIFGFASAPAWVRALMALRQATVGLIGVERGDTSVFRVREVEGEEALIAHDDRHLDFRGAVGVDAEQGLLRVTTAVRLHGWRGRLYFLPVSVLHDPVTRAMARRAVARHAGDAAAHTATPAP